ncbi:MAG: UDP-N-acetylmuramoyl-L-alanyl-D-glutamate--2,6-diaminopimelate ligase [Lachnospiraceae bacterium]|nr:UDP-N-acetylmuramoyl-L-alanyl-D-glutamate--2,6-diaminopimelate ligase [Lachnospiraceae bacterium]
MQIKQLLDEIEYEVLAGTVDVEVTGLVYDSRKVEKGSVFVCISGAVRDAHDFIPEVVEKGAAAIVVEKPVEPVDGVTYVRVENTRKALAYMSASYFGHPADKLKTIGITGTKGKTTTTYMVKSILESAGMKTGLIGTIEAIIGEEHIPAANTTPESYVVQEYFRKMVDAGMDAVVMEVSSQAMMLHRVSGFTFDIGVFTNLEPDHIGENEHKDFADYMHCKSLLFRQCKKGIFNGDSEHLDGILEGHTCEVETFGYGAGNDLQAQNVELLKDAGALGVHYHVAGLMSFDVDVNVPGSFSVYNSLTAIAICHHFGVEESKIKDALAKVTVKGRIEIVPVTNRYTLMIDYAHNAMSLESLLTTLRAYEPGRLVCLFGCGGNRAKSRRYEMGEVSSRLADLTVVTSDNPRNEDPMDIISDILVGVHKADGEYVTIPDRKEAIAYCMKHAQDGDIIVLAGKGHEDYQEIKGVKHHMDERELIAEIIRENPDLRLEK